jgi:outer membrane protein assembly factor BamA
MVDLAFLLACLAQAEPLPVHLAQDPPSAAREASRPQDAPKQEPVDQAPSFYPMVSLGVDKDSGATYGVLGALMFTNAEGRQDALITATIAYQHLMKWSGELDFRYYPTLTGMSDVDAYWAQRVENLLRLFYEETHLDDRYHLRVELLASRTATDRFYGRGDDQPKSAASARTSNEYHTEFRFGPRLSDILDVEGTFRYRHFRVGNSLITDIPQTLELYPNEPGIEGGQILAAGIRFVLDSRDNQTTPEVGVYATAYFERATDYTQGRWKAFWNSGGTVTALWPLDPDHRFVTVANFATQEAIGSYIPFWELPALGGSTTLRSYNGARFTNNYMILANLEERIRLVELSLFGVGGEIQVAPFFDVGKVFDSMDDLVGSGFAKFYHFSAGIGLRGVVKPFFVGRLDVAVGGSEGVGVIVALDYPF